MPGTHPGACQDKNAMPVAIVTGASTGIAGEIRTSSSRVGRVRAKDLSLTSAPIQVMASTARRLQETSA